MTTREAAARYEADHVRSVAGKKLAVYNPQNLPLDELPTIYGFNNGGSNSWYSAIAMSEDGHCLGGHTCSSEAYMPSDLGLLEGTRPDRHKDNYQKHYPLGYKMEWIPSDQVNGHAKLAEAYRLNQELAKSVEALNKEET